MKVFKLIGAFLLNCLPGGGLIYYNQRLKQINIDQEAFIKQSNLALELMRDIKITPKPYLHTKPFSEKNTSYTSAIAGYADDEYLNYLIANCEACAVAKMKQPLMINKDLLVEQQGILKGIDFIRLELQRIKVDHNNVDGE